MAHERDTSSPRRRASLRTLPLLTVGLLVVGMVSAPPAAAAPASRVVSVSGDITTDTTWSRAEADVYLVDSRPTISEDATLTIDAGVVVAFANYSGLYVEGALVSAGTADAPVIFTAASDETVPGLPGIDGIPVRTDYWNGLESGFGGRSMTLDHTEVRYAGIDTTSTLSLRNSSVTGTARGVRARGDGDATIVDSRVTGDLDVHRFSAQRPDVPVSSTVTGNVVTTGRLIVSSGYPGGFTVRDNTVIGAFHDIDEPVGLQPAIALSAPNLDPADFATNTATGGDRDVIGLEGALAKSWTVPAKGLPYEIGGLGLTTTVGLTIARGTTLTLPPNASLTVHRDFRGPALTVDGRLVAAATPSRPATITFVATTGQPARSDIIVRGAGAAAAYGLSLRGEAVANTAGTFGTARPSCGYLVTADRAAQTCR